MFGNGLANSSVHGWCGFQECGEGGEGGRSVGKVEKGDGQLAPLEAISSLVTQLLRTAQEGRRMDGKAPSEGKLSPLSAVLLGKRPLGEGVGEGVFLVWTPGTWGEPMFTSGHFFSISARWSVDVRNGQCRATRTDRTRLGSTPGNEGWSGWEGQPSGPSGIEVRLTPAGELVRGDASRLGSCRWSVGSDLTGLRVNRLFRHWGATPQRIVDGMNESCWTALKGCWEVGTQWCWSLRLGWMFSAGGSPGVRNSGT